MSDPVVTSKLAEALAKAQGKFKTPVLNRTADILKDGRLLYQTHYADLQECISCVQGALSENGLSFTQTVDFIHTPKEMWVLRLTLRHGSGELIDSVFPLNMNLAPQQLGGSLTYFKRYQISAFFGLAADFDDDGNAAEDKGKVVDGKPREPAKKPAQQPLAKPHGTTKPNYQKPPVKPATHPDENPQEFPPDDTEKPPKPPEIDPKDPGEHVVLFGHTTTGKKIKQLNEKMLREMLDYVDMQLKLVPPPSNLSILFDFKTKAKAFLASVGVEV